MTVNVSKHGRIPFPNLPLPQKRTVIKVRSEVKTISVTPAPLPAISIPDHIIGGTPEPEPPKTQHKGDHTIENLDLSDYQ